MALYIPHSIFHLARLLYVGPETFGPYYVTTNVWNKLATFIYVSASEKYPEYVIVKQYVIIRVCTLA